MARTVWGQHAPVGVGGDVVGVHFSATRAPGVGVCVIVIITCYMLVSCILYLVCTCDMCDV